MYCPNCGSEITSNNNFCPNCGIDLYKNNSTNKKNVIMSMSVIVVIILLFFVCSALGRRILVKRYYNKGYNAYLNWLEYTDDGRNLHLGWIEDDDEPEQIMSDIKVNFDKCLNLIGDNRDKYHIDYNLAENCYYILYAYTDLKNTRVSYYDEEIWKDYLDNISYMEYTNNEKINSMIDVLKSECEAALLYYEFDYQGAYDKIEWCQEYFEDFIDDLYYTSFGIEFLENCEFFDFIKNKNLTVEEYGLECFHSDYSNSAYFNISSEFPLIIFNFYLEGELYELYWCNNNGYYTLYEMNLASENELTKLTVSSYGYNTNDKGAWHYYAFEPDFIEEICLQIDEINFLKEVPEHIKELDAE